MTHITSNLNGSVPYFKPIEFQENNSNKGVVKKAFIAIGRSCDRYLYLGDKTKVLHLHRCPMKQVRQRTLWTVKDVKSTASHCKRTIGKILKIISFILLPVAPLVCSAIKLAYKYSYVRNKLSSVENLSASKIPNNEKLEDAIKHPLDRNLLKTPRQQDKIDEGYGEYVVFQKGPGNTKRHISPQLFEKVYQIFQKYAPGALAIEYKDNLQEGLKKYENRYSLISHEIQLIDKNLEIAFIPRTLYELNSSNKRLKKILKKEKLANAYKEALPA